MLEETRLLPALRAEMVHSPGHHPKSAQAGLLARTPLHYVTKHLQQGIESDHFRVKKNMPRIGGFQAFHTRRFCSHLA